MARRKKTPLRAEKSCSGAVCSSIGAVFRWGHARDPFEDPGEIIGVGIAAGQADLPDTEPGGGQLLLGLLHPEFVEPGGKIDLEALLE